MLYLTMHTTHFILRLYGVRHTVNACIVSGTISSSIHDPVSQNRLILTT